MDGLWLETLLKWMIWGVPLFLETPKWKYIIYPGSPSRPSGLPIDRIGNPESIYHPKDQPLCLVERTSRVYAISIIEETSVYLCNFQFKIKESGEKCVNITPLNGTMPNYTPQPPGTHFAWGLEVGETHWEVWRSKRSSQLSLLEVQKSIVSWRKKLFLGGR